MKIKYNKPPLSIPQQIQQMKDRGIIFTDEKKAEIFLSNNNYYKIAFYYKKLKFENNDFEFYCNLYNQDRKLSSLLLKYISIFEDSLKTKYAYCFSNSTNSSHPHLESSLFIKDYDKLKTRWTNTFNDNNQEYKKHYLEKYEETLPPIWVLVESFPLGLLCNTIKKTNHTHLLDFYSSFNYPTKLLSSFFYSLLFVRNLCAHNAIIMEH